MKNFELVNRDVVFQGKLMNIHRDVIRFDNGKETIREAIDKKHEASAVAAVDQDGKMIFVEQYRYGTGLDMLEVPAGLLDPGEDPQEAAVRELEEETGLKASSCVHLFDFYCTPGYCNEKIYMYLCTDLVETQQDLDDDEYINIHRFTVDEAIEMIADGRIVDGKTIALVFALKNHFKM